MSTKNKILNILEQNKGEFFSGEILANNLSISRSAVWKAINGLRKDGYIINAITNKGYSLSSTSDLLSIEGIFPFLEDQTLLDKIHIYKTLKSTNTTAKKMLLDNAPYGTIIIAEEQTEGRGRFGRSFYSPLFDSVYISFILKPHFEIEKTQLVTVAASVAVSRTIEKLTDSKCQIKWVNDIFIQEKKVCGILTEAMSNIETGDIESLILGIGININMSENDFPPEIRDIAGSVTLPNGNRNKFIAYLINEVFKSFKDIENPNVITHYKDHSLVIGKRIYVIKGQSKVNALALDITNEGNLLVEYDTGKRESLNAGEISLKFK